MDRIFLCFAIVFSVCSTGFGLEGLLCRRFRKRTILKGVVDFDSPLSVIPTDLPTDYVFVPPEVGSQIYIGTIVSLIPIVYATIEFTSRIRVQRNCLVCSGSGLTYSTKRGTTLSRPRKCWSCGGFIPWLGWRMFFLSTFTDPGNGGVLQRPSPDYDETNKRIREAATEATDNNSEENESKEKV